VVTSDEDHCYLCGASMPRITKRVANRRPVSAWTNLVFILSLGFTAYCFFAEHKLSLPLTIAISSTLLLLRILAEQLANRHAETTSN